MEDGSLLFIIRCILVTRPITKVIIEKFLNVILVIFPTYFVEMLNVYLNIVCDRCEQILVLF